MTLVVSLITGDFVCHVSDRRLTDAVTGRQLTSQASKTVVVLPMRLLVSYTGLAQMNGTDTDEWLVRTIHDLRDSDDFFGELGTRAAAAMRSVSLPSASKRHLFVLSGWFPPDMPAEAFPDDLHYSPPSDGRPTAYCCVITNFLSDDGRWLNLARPIFINRMRLLPPREPFHAFPVGAELTSAELSGLDTGLASAFRSNRGKERAASALLIRALKEVGARDATVGGGVFVSALARVLATQTTRSASPEIRVMQMKWGLPEANEATFVHLPDTGNEIVESPFVVDEKTAVKMVRLRVSGAKPGLAGAGQPPKEGEVELRVIKLAD
jgi:hypothetical protein